MFNGTTQADKINILSTNNSLVKSTCLMETIIFEAYLIKKNLIKLKHQLLMVCKMIVSSN